MVSKNTIERIKEISKTREHELLLEISRLRTSFPDMGVLFDAWSGDVKTWRRSIVDNLEGGGRYE